MSAKCRELENSAQENVAGPDDLDRPIVEQQAKRAVRLESGEAAADMLVLARRGRVSRVPTEVRALFPGADQRRTFARPPQREQPSEAAREQRREGLAARLRRRATPLGGRAASARRRD